MHWCRAMVSGDTGPPGEGSSTPRVRIFRGYSAARCSRRQMPHILPAEQGMHAHVKPGIGYTCVNAKGIAVGRHRRRDEGDDFPEQERL